MSEQKGEYKTAAGRKSGYYWVRKNASDGFMWEIAYWDQKEHCWFYEGERSDCDSSIKFEFVNEIRIKDPDEL